MCVFQLSDTARACPRVPIRQYTNGAPAIPRGMMYVALMLCVPHDMKVCVKVVKVNNEINYPPVHLPRDWSSLNSN